MTLTPITVTLHETDAHGNPARGSYWFRLDTPITDTSSGTTVAATDQIATLDASGNASIVLTATDDPTTTPVGAAYRVVERLKGGSGARTFYIQVPHTAASGTATLESLVVDVVEPPTFPVRGDTGPAGASGPAGADSGLTYASYAVVTALPTAPGNGTTAYVRGHTSANDGGGGVFIYNVSSSATVNGGTVLNGPGGVGRWLRDHHPNEYHAAWFGIVGQGADEGAALNTVITSLGSDTTLVLGDGTYVLETGAVLAADYLLIGGQGEGRTTLKAKDGSDFLAVVAATNRAGVHLMNLTIDANQANRSGVLTQRALGISMTGMTDLRLIGVTVMNTYGFGGVSAVGFAVSGGSQRVTARDCTAINCGTVGHASDGFFFSGNAMAILGCRAENCLDTGFVLEKCNDSVIGGGCIARSCSAPAAITASGGSTNYANNMIDGLIVDGWNATNTGAIQISALSTGNLLDTQVLNVTFNGTGGTGVGPIIYVRKPSTGRVIGVTIGQVNANGGTAQGILIEGEEVQVASSRIVGTALAPIQFRAGASGGLVTGNYLEATIGQFGVYVDGTVSPVNDVHVLNNAIVGASVSGSYGIYWAGTNTGAKARFNDITGFSSARVGSDAGTVPMVLSEVNLNVGGGFTAGKQQDVNMYRNAADQWKTDDQLVAGGAFVMKTKAGPPTDADLAVVTVGACILDITNNDLYFRVTGGWKKVTLT